MTETTAIQCPHCGASFKAKSKAAFGKKVACPKCQTPFVVPGPKAAPKKVKKKQKSASLMDAWGDDDLNEEAPVRKGPSTRKPQRSGKRSNKQQSAGKSTMVVGLLVIAVIVGGGVMFIASRSTSSDQKTENPALAESESVETEPVANEPGETPVMKTQSSETAPASNPTTKLVFKIVAIHENLGKIIRYRNNPNTNEEKQIKQAEGVAERSLASTLGDKFLNQISFLDVDLKKKELSFSMREPIPDNLVQDINSVSFQMVSVAPLKQSLHEELIEKHGADKLIVHELEFHLSNIIPEYKKQLNENYEQGSKALYQALNEQFEQSVPEYIPNSLKLDLEYKKLTFQVIQPPASNLGVQINQLSMIPVTISATPYRDREVRTEEQKKITQATYQIVLNDFHERALANQNSYNFWRNSINYELEENLERHVSGYILDTLDLDLGKGTATFQLDHPPGELFSVEFNGLIGNQVKLVYEPLSLGPPEPPFQTPGRPMKQVVLKITNADEYIRDRLTNEIKPLTQNDLLNIHREINRLFLSDISYYIDESIRIDFQNMLLGFQIDRVPPGDFLKQIHSIGFLKLEVDDKIVSIEDVDYDPEVSEKTMIFSFVNNGQRLAQFDEINQQRSAENNLHGLSNYISRSLQMDFQQGTFKIRLRAGRNEAAEIQAVTNGLNAIKISCTHLNTIPPKPGGPTGKSIPGMVSNSNQPTPIASDQNLKVTIQFGLYSGRGKMAKSARDVLDGFSWVDLKSLKVDAANKEISFNTTGPMNEAALDRLLKRQKFYQCIIKKEPLPEEAAKE
ncbi:hypothetical protein Pan241w_54250 [Gimesia alba]|uniref:Zinc finger/thioredoxin putative domain-containing protein n=1 Tax=Gimesia alba TaxID=2527973 RepID=A0A517RN50_9PLAN|nr:MJ0042-type zinc finger domain-containing protein [Gimesia alba]QDT45305.1 hypothetical protein Pan241w_54250 [Gimesia alba]